MNSVTDQKPSESNLISKSWSALVMLAFALPFLFGGSCFDIATPIEDFSTTTENALNDAIDALNNASADWQRILEELKEELPEQVQSTVRVEVANLVTRSIGQAGVELRCDIDFIRVRVRQAIERIKIKFIGGTPSPTEPSICQVVPLAVDRALVPGRINQIEFYGYDFDQASDLKVFHVRTNGRQNVTNQLDRPTHYAMTLKFGATGVQLDDRSVRFSLEWGGRTISTIAIIQPPTPVCQTRTERFQPGPVTFMPGHTRGDRDFKGHGPTINARVELLVNQRRISARVYMEAYESNPNNTLKRDYTTVRGSKVFPLYNAPSGFRINRVLGSSITTHRYRDSDHAKDSFNMGSGGLVKRFLYVGDTKGSEAGLRTQVDVTFNRLSIELVETGDCVAARTLMSLKKLNLIQSTTFQRLESSAVQELERAIQFIDIAPDSTN